ncbi:MAG: SDR family NAD(P)-dependent oxidoreductase [Nitrospirae bacterium]|nr:SDR family NAD(P)-dependent oxidoreductase [Nitrospirota bacterium]
MLDKKVVLITGASSGLGRAAADLLASSGYVVYGTSRNPASSASDNFNMLRLDVRDDDSVRACISEVLNKEGHIDVLLCNAGYALSGAVEEVSVSEAKSLMETNFFGVVRMVCFCLPHMRQQGSGRIIITSSVAGMIGLPYHAYYSASKYALEGYAEALSREVHDKGICVSLVQPGFFRSNIADSLVLAEQRVSAYETARNKALKIFRSSVKTGKSSEELASLVKRIVESDTPQLRYLCAGWSRWFLALRRFMPQRLFEAAFKRYIAL